VGVRSGVSLIKDSHGWHGVTVDRGSKRGKGVVRVWEG